MQQFPPLESLLLLAFLRTNSFHKMQEEDQREGTAWGEVLQGWWKVPPECPWGKDSQLVPCPVQCQEAQDDK